MTQRSTKAGASTPATHAGCPILRLHGLATALNEGRSVNPGDTDGSTPPFQRRPERASSLRALNEGRSVNPGDTCGGCWIRSWTSSAQRRPERQPRRHDQNRSTPADAQRRPERQPRRTAERRASCRGIARSTKAGASTPATPCRTQPSRPRAIVRSTKAGASTPATLDRTLNEAERQPRRQYGLRTLPLRRSTKAGASTPATPADCAEAGRWRTNRSTKAGASTPATPVPPAACANTSSGSRRGAQRRPERQPRRHLARSTKAGASTPGVRGCNSISALRSTKAGASTPATLGRRCRALPHSAPLNEGRSVNPGDTHLARLFHDDGTACFAQRRPERQPRRHAISRTAATGRSRPLNEGRSVNPGDTRLQQAVTSALDGVTAQRRPERQPRRHACIADHRAGRSVNPGDTPAALNEGRSVNPGDTPPRDGATPAETAQRRPERQPRRHHVRDRVPVRSTKAGRQPRRHR